MIDLAGSADISAAHMMQLLLQQELDGVVCCYVLQFVAV